MKTKRLTRTERQRIYISAQLPLPAPESALAPAPYLLPVGWEMLDWRSSQGVLHRSIAGFDGILIGYQHMSVYACILACHLSHCFPECVWLVSGLVAEVEEVLPGLGRCAFTPPASIILSMAEQIVVDFSKCMPKQ